MNETEACFEHGKVSCARCTSDGAWFAMLTEATELEDAAKRARKNNIFAHPDIERVAVEWDRSASEIRGKLQAIADQEARDLENAAMHWSLGGGR